MQGSLRQRTRAINSNNEFDDNLNLEDRCDKNFHASECTYKGTSWILILLVHVALAYFVQERNNTFPEPISQKSGSVDDFSEERARNYLHGLTNLGSRIVGSHENELLAVEFLKNEIKKINESQSVGLHKKRIELYVQEASGSFDLDFLGGFTNVYQNIKNVIVKLTRVDADDDNSALLVNCHYDTFINTPGTSDDAVSCAIMLEVLRTLVEHETYLPHDVIFLFNGAEETILQGSHAFVTSHRWFHNIKAFVNLEAAGAGGKELLFQSSSQQPWLLSLYVESVPHPFASILAEEIFQSGLIQSETDFRIFRDYGKLPGLDIAYIKNGYVYHTRHDTPDKIPEGCIQRGGENLLSLVKSIASSSYLTNPSAYQYKQLVFFDLIGYSVIFFRASFLFAFNNLLCLLVHLKVLSSLSYKGYLFHLTTAVLITMLTWLAAMLSVSTVAVTMDFFGFSMTWFTNNWLLIGLYSATSLAAVIWVINCLKSYWLKVTKLSPSRMEQLIDDAQMVIISTSLIWLSWKQVASSFLLTTYLASFLTKFCLISIFKWDHKDHYHHHLTTHLLTMIPSATLNYYFLEGTINTFIPLMGRAGPSKNPDLIIGVMVAVFTIYSNMFHLGVMMITKSLKNHLKILSLTFVACLALATLTEFGFPYNNHDVYPVNQRVFFQHVRRRFHNSSIPLPFDENTFQHQQQHGNEKDYIEDNSIIFVPLDRTKLQHLRQHVKTLNKKEIQTYEDFSTYKILPCLNKPYCGWPFYLPLITHMDEVYYQEAHPLSISPVVLITNFDSLVFDGGESVNYTLSIKGPNYLSIYISTISDVYLTWWSLGNHIPTPTEMPDYIDNKHYFIYVARGDVYNYGWRHNNNNNNNNNDDDDGGGGGRKYDEIFMFNFTIQRSHTDRPLTNKNNLQIAILGHHFSTTNKTHLSPTLASIEQILPNWTAKIITATTYDSWVV